ncbi:MAG: glycosyltransferase [Acidobacteria bacterium]|nr:glycosyltransferase [Acidobacteriota bacterium]
MEGVSFVVPVHNGAAWIRDTFESILSQADGRPMEVIVVDDCSRDESSGILRQLAESRPLRNIAIIAGDGRGAAAAINTGVRAARFPIICQVDQDVVLQAGWMRHVTEAFADPAVAAVQGYYVSDRDATLCARAMSRDLEQRYAAIEGQNTDHVCTGNSAYRAEALRRIGLFDETFGYGYDNDMSYRLRAAGYRLAFCRTARSVHRWREGLAGYVVQQYGFGYGRIDLVAKHPTRFRGDSVSRAGMMSHPLLMSMAVAGLVSALAMAVTAGPWRALAWGSAALLAGLALERFAAGVAAARRFRDPTPLLFPALHLARDLAWVAAIAMWSARRLGRRPRKPSHSMRPRVTPASRGLQTPLDLDAPAVAARPARPMRILCLIPAHNEAASLTAVVGEVRRSQPDLDVLVVDDGSTDETTSLLARLDVRWLRFPERMGVGCAMRAGLRYAARLGYDVVARVDGDGQHRADDIDRLLAPIRDGRADVVLGSRYAGPNADLCSPRRLPGPKGPGLHVGMTRLLQRLLAICLSALTGRRVTDPTSGFCVVGPRAVRVLAEHHPTGYPEPELRLFLSRNALNVVEVPVRARRRLGGRTSLTAGRLTAAGARVALAMLIVPLRCRVGGSIGD